MERVLLVNDSKFESIIMKDILNTMGYDVKISDEYDAMSNVRTFKPDFLISNYIMKEIRGDQLIAMVKLQNPGIRCLLCSSFSFEGDKVTGRRIDAVIKTPVGKSELEKIFSRFYKEENLDYEIITKKEIENKNRLSNFCGGCGRELARGGEQKFSFCPYCGHRLEL